MGMESPQSQTVRAGQIPHRWTRVDDPGAEFVVAAYETVIAGGGPAGLTGAYELTRARVGEERALRLFDGSALVPTASQPSRSLATPTYRP